MIPGGREGALAPGLARLHLRWWGPAALLAAEGLAISLLVDLPVTGAAMPVVGAVRVAIPVVLGAAVAGWLVARSGQGGSGLPAQALPPWRPGATLVAQGAAFAATLALALRLLGAGAPPPGWPGMLALLGAGTITVALAAGVAVPLPWLAREALQRWRAPLLALAVGLGVWRAASAAEQLWGTLAGITLRGSAAVLGALGMAPAVDAAQALIEVGDFAVTVAPECSGVDGIGLVLMFGLTWLAMARERIHVGRALLLVPPAVAVVFAASIARIAGLVLLGAAGYVRLAVGGFHSKVGWAFFVALALGFVALAERLPWLRRAPVAPAPQGERAPRADAALLAPLVLALAAALVTGIWMTGPLDRAYGLRILAALAGILAVRRALPSLRPSPGAAAAVAGALVGVLWVAGVRGDPGPLREELAGVGAWGGVAWLAVRTLGSVLVIPVVEELAFRGFLFDFLAPPAPEAGGRRGLPWVAVAVSSLAFGALHSSFVAGALAGLAFGALRAWRGRLGDAVVAHAAANLVVAAAALGLGRWDLWG